MPRLASVGSAPTAGSYLVNEMIDYTTWSTKLQGHITMLKALYDARVPEAPPLPAVPTLEDCTSAREARKYFFDISRTSTHVLCCCAETARLQGLDTPLQRMVSTSSLPRSNHSPVNPIDLASPEPILTALAPPPVPDNTPAAFLDNLRAQQAPTLLQAVQSTPLGQQVIHAQNRNFTGGPNSIG